MSKVPKKSFGWKCHIRSDSDWNTAVCGAAVAGQGLSAFCREVITCRSCRKHEKFKTLPQRK